jgi:anti-anti-sigma factor
MQLRALVYSEDASTVLRLVGPLTRHSVPTMEEPLVTVLEPIGQRLVLDLGQISECDSAGAAALLGIWQMSRDRAGETSFARPTPAVRSWLRHAAFSDVAIYRTVGGADRGDAGQRMDPIVEVSLPHPRRAPGFRPHHAVRPQHGARPANAANAVYARPKRRPPG